MCPFDDTRDCDRWSWLSVKQNIIQMNNCRRYIWLLLPYVSTFNWKYGLFLFSEITQNGLKLVVLDFGFVFDQLVQHIFCSDWFGKQYILASTFCTDYILAGTYGTYYILDVTYGTYYILIGSYIWHRLYSSRWGTYFVMTVSDFTISCSNKIVRVKKNAKG